jgi:exosome complex component RRP42
MALEVNRLVSTLERNYILRSLQDGKRADGRGLWDFRDVRIEINFSPKAEGSADVFLGETRVMAGVKYDIGAPFSDNPDEGVCTVMSEFVPMASAMFESGPPSEDSIQLARVVDRGIRHGNCLDYKALCIIPNKSVYILFVDCYIMDYFGNLIDASAIAAMAALVSTRLPRAKIENDEVVWDGGYKALPIKELPLSVSFGKLDKYIFVDPSLAEEMCLDGSISFAVDESGNVNSMQKFGNAAWTPSEILECSKKAIELAKGLREKLNLKQYIPKDLA